jgi:peptide/nickel transport system permease protein
VTARHLRFPKLGVLTVVLGLVAFMCAFGGVLAPHDPIATDTAHTFAPLSWSHPLGTDALGRDTLSRLMAGTRVSVLSAAFAVLIGFVLGGIPGVASVFIGPGSSYALQRVVDAFMMLPQMVFAIAIVTAFGNGIAPAVFAIGILLMPRSFRIMRAETLKLANAQYVEMATLLGASWSQIVRRHVWRKVLPTAAVTLTTGMGYSVLAISSLSFLGLGVIAPAPSWGGMLTLDLTYIYQAPYAAIWPGLATLITVWSFNALGDRARVREATAIEAAEPIEPQAIPTVAHEPLAERALLSETV